MNINNRTFRNYDVYAYNPTNPHEGYRQVGYIQILPVPMEELIAYANKVFPKLKYDEVYVIANRGEKPIYNKPNPIMNNTLKMNSVANLLQATRANGFIVGSFTAGNGLSFSAEPAVHASAALARQEAKRLAGINPGKYFLFLQVRGGEFVQPQPTSTSF